MMEMSVPKPKQGLAITSMVLGILSLVCLSVGVGAVLGPPAVITGHLARRRMKRSPDQYGGRKLALAGLITGYLSTALVATALSFIAYWVPRVAKMQNDFSSERCVYNLKELGQAARVFSEDNKYRFPDSFQQMSNEIRNPNLLVCPADPDRRGPQGWDETNITYQFLEPGIQETPDTMTKVVFRCPIHGHTVTVDGAVQGGTLSPPPKSKTKR
jgi:hypothetical protein